MRSRSPRLSALTRRCAIIVLALTSAAPLAAYTVWLKDGSSLAARGKYEVRNGKAIITLTNGTQTFIDAAKIDVPKTEASNRGADYGITDLGNTRVLPGDETPPPQQKSITDLIATHSPSSRRLPSARRERDNGVPGQPSRSKAGYLDLESLPRTPFARTEVTAELLQFFRSQNIDEVQVYAGSQADHLLVEIATASEGSVFQSVTASANALLRLRDRFPQQVSALELLLKAPAHEKAGQFVLTPEHAADLVAKKVDVPAYFIANVQF
jgi:hypothetical protein